MNSNLAKIIIAVDGPAGSGKSTVSKIIAQKLDLTYIDTGAMYRGIALLSIKAKLNPETQIDEICKLAETAHFRFEDCSKKIFLNNEDISSQIRTPEISKIVSQISTIPLVRDSLIKLQREIGENGGAIMDGRDIGTNVFPNANVKIFLLASSKIRAQRRYDEQINIGINQSLEEVLYDIEKRDFSDYNRSIAPLKQAEDAFLVDTDEMTVEQVVNRIIEIIYEKINISN